MYYRGGGSKYLIMQVCALFFASFLLFAFTACRQNAKKEDGAGNEITVTVRGDENVVTESSASFKVKKGSVWSAVKPEAEKKVSYKQGFEHDVWKLTDENGAELKDPDIFNTDSTVYAISKPDQTEKITITVKGDSNVIVSYPPAFKTNKNSTWSSVKLLAEQKVSYNHGFEHGVWKLTDETGEELNDSYTFGTDAAVFAVSKTKTQTASFKWRFAASGDGSTYAIRSDGTLWTCGWNEDGQLGVPSVPLKTAKFTCVGTDKNWKFAAAGKAYAFMIKEDGTLWALGSNEKGVQGIGNGKKNKVPAQIGTDTDWIFVTASRFWGYNGFAIKQNGSLWGWGSNMEKQLVSGKQMEIKPKQIGSDTDWTYVSVGQNQVLAIKQDGSLWGWGSNIEKGLGMGDGAPDIISEPTRIGTGNDWALVSAVADKTYAIKQDGTLWGCGHNINNIIGLNQSAEDFNEYIKEFTKISAVTGQVINITGYENAVAAAAGEGKVIKKVYTWGSNEDGALGDGNGKIFGSPEIPFSAVPVEVPLPAGVTYKQITAGQAFTILITTDGKMYGWGRNKGGQLGDNTDTDQLQTSFYKKPFEIACPQDEI